jgi:hypothetical protein
MADADHLRRLAYLMLAPSLGRRRRLDLASDAAGAAREAGDPVARLVTHVLHATAGRTGMVLFARSDGVDRELGALPPAARIAYVLEHVQGLTAQQASDVLRAAGVTDPETAIALAGKSPLEPVLLAGIQVRDPSRGRGSRRIAAAAAVVATGVVVPVVALNSGGHDHATDTGVSRPLGGSPAPTTPAAPAAAAASPNMAAELRTLLTKIDSRLKSSVDPTDRKKLQQLREAVAARLAQLPR